ncbi:PEP-CTERM sorting domain-containing protein [Rubripirellula reticaptiva]|uniref:PEP-CTERM protein-sorting domain-containing protein n=1 Tax=Rubripirellula reticaptiva TaxID=2528013 RepID=A0A5C6EQV3_9BACT|nr:PEP-CTERM sorting domain-containing protein [Rubripirellula reticaptiva]TWU51432.1 hypothetical protein Poly59_30240 [Rubripirellula reticaptiva]
MIENRYSNANFLSKLGLFVTFEIAVFAIASPPAYADLIYTTYLYNSDGFTDIGDTYRSVDYDGSTVGWSALRSDGSFYVQSQGVIDTSSLSGEIVDWAFSTSSGGYVITRSIAVPEPSSVLSVGLLFLFLGIARRRIRPGSPTTGQ